MPTRGLSASGLPKLATPLLCRLWSGERPVLLLGLACDVMTAAVMAKIAKGG